MVINLTSFNVLSAYLDSSPMHYEVHIMKHIFTQESFCCFQESSVYFFVSTHVFVAFRLCVLSNFQLIMKFYSFGDILHCFSRSLRWSNRLGSSWVGIWKKRNILWNQKVTLIFFVRFITSWRISDLLFTDCRLQLHQCICIDFWILKLTISKGKG